MATWIIIIASALLGLAGTLKIVETFSTTNPIHTSLSSRYGLAVGMIEIMFALFVVTFRSRIWTIWVVVALFTSFAGFAGYRLFTGHADCGCFGLVKIPPLVTLSIDVLIVFSLMLTTSTYTAFRYALPGFLLLGSLAAHADTTLSGTCVVPIDRLVGHQLNIPPEVTRVIVYDPHCPKCQWVKQGPSAIESSPTQRVMTYEELGKLVVGLDERCFVMGDGILTLSIQDRTLTKSVKGASSAAV